MAKRRPPQPGAGHFHGSGQYVRQIIKCLEKVNAVSGYHAYQIFDDWTQLVEACLEALPTHLTSVAQTGQMAEDTPETKTVFERLQARYEPSPYRSNSADVWSQFSQALAILLESSEPGLWGPGSYGNFDVGYMGPDVIGHTYMLYATPNQALAQIFTPWNVALLLGRLNITSGEQQIHERLKQACQHPDNILAQATLLAGLAIDDPQEAREWFFSRVLPAAWPTFEPLKVGDPAGCGSGVLLLAAAACFPVWAVHLNCVTFQGIDIDPVSVRLAKINCYLYGLNGYYLKFAEALQSANNATHLKIPGSHKAAYQQAVNVYKGKSPIAASVPTFEALFRPQPVEKETQI
ncbi:MAG: SAM-dependent DNA methyltransferase [Anaerolineae bacterium]|nr:SAM-dependent DNA methyltransferase [Anaerolineae bacterium]